MATTGRFFKLATTQGRHLIIITGFFCHDFYIDFYIDAYYDDGNDYENDDGDNHYNDDEPEVGIDSHTQHAPQG